MPSKRTKSFQDEASLNTFQLDAECDNADGISGSTGREECDRKCGCAHSHHICLHDTRPVKERAIILMVSNGNLWTSAAGDWYVGSTIYSKKVTDSKQVPRLAMLEFQVRVTPMQELQAMTQAASSYRKVPWLLSLW